MGQADDLRALAEREGWDIVREYVDEGLSGGKRRQAADESLRMLREGEADVMAAFSVDRYSRQGIGEDAAVIRAVREGAKRATGLAPRVVFIREGIDSAVDPQGWAARYAQWSEMAYTERELMVARRKGSIRRMQTAGRFTGRGLEPWGSSCPMPRRPR
jgi:DNA invertase Pin-like site-specific DNA recombinase